MMLCYTLERSLRPHRSPPQPCRPARAGFPPRPLKEVASACATQAVSPVCIQHAWLIVCQRHHLSSCHGRSRTLFSGAVAGAKSAQAAVHPSAGKMSITAEIIGLVTILHEASAPDPHLILQTSRGDSPSRALSTSWEDLQNRLMTWDAEITSRPF
jgi:hypothetical protein